MMADILGRRGNAVSYLPVVSQLGRFQVFYIDFGKGCIGVGIGNVIAMSQALRCMT